MANYDSADISFPRATTLSHRIKLAQFLQSSRTNTFTTLSPPHHHHHHHDESSSSSDSEDHSSCSSNSTSRRPSHEYDNTSITSSPHWSQSSSHDDSPYTKSPWIKLSSVVVLQHNKIQLIGSLVREDGHIYSLAASSNFLYTGSDSKNIRVWAKFSLSDSGGFKSGSGLVKSIVVGHDRKLFTGHQDGKIRIWQATEDAIPSHKRVGSLPTRRNSLKSWLNQTKRNTEKHSDAVSCLSLDKATGLLYSASWDKTVKVWRLKNSKCVETIKAHHDSVNSVVVAGFGGLVFSGSADGTVKVWRREMKKVGKSIHHMHVQTLMEQTNAVTSLAVMSSSGTLYAGSSDGLVSFWVWDKKKDIMRYGGVLRGHKLAVLCLATAGSLVLSGSADGAVCVWKREEAGVGGDHVCISVLTGHTGPVKCLAVDHEDSVDTSSDEENRQCNADVRVVDRRWRVYSGSLVRQFRQGVDDPRASLRIL